MIEPRFDEAAGMKYRKYHHALNELLKKSKNDYFREQASKHKHDSRGLWRCVKGIADQRKQNDRIDHLKLDNGNISRSCQEIINSFNNYFAEIGSSLAAKVKTQ
ncbi:hypothetical protein HHI36_020084, partial [Cryptolaemus montrouzieri]